MRYIVLSILLLAVNLTSAYGWGKKGHDVIAYIAECHLAPEVLARIETILDGRTMVYYSNWMDGASNRPEHSYSKSWHYFNMGRRDSVLEAERHKKGDLLSAVTDIEAKMRSGTLTPEDEKVALMMMIHLIGDMHQPMHLGEAENEGGGMIPVVYFVESTSLHAMWDYHIVEGAHSWSYTEWQIQIDRESEEREREITSGSYVDWLSQTHEVTKLVYRKTPAESRIFYEYVDDFRPIIEEQFLKAGVRLAHILNSIYTE